MSDIGFQLDIKEQQRGFFDRASVAAAIGAPLRSGLQSAGSLVRTTAQRSMRYATRKRTRSQPGEPPLAHRNEQTAKDENGRVKRDANGKAIKEKTRGLGPLLRKLLFYSYDPAKRVAVVGPSRLGDSITPRLHEFGGTRSVTFPRFSGGRVVGHRTVVQNYKPRPYMRPALEKQAGKIAQIMGLAWQREFARRARAARSPARPMAA